MGRLDSLLNISGTKLAHATQAETNPQFRVNWNAVRDWSEASRYDSSTTETKARDMLVAVTDPTFGVLPWLKTQW